MFLVWSHLHPVMPKPEHYVSHYLVTGNMEQTSSWYRNLNQPEENFNIKEYLQSLIFTEENVPDVEAGSSKDFADNILEHAEADDDEVQETGLRVFMLICQGFRNLKMVLHSWMRQFLQIIKMMI